MIILAKGIKKINLYYLEKFTPLPNSEKILVIDNDYSNKFNINGSTFIGHAIRIASIEDANNKLGSIRKEYYSATHHCYAYKLRIGEEKYSDDGEPSGTAGIRILNSINSHLLTDILVVVVRYFGGTKLGIGPLGKAYMNTANELLETAQKVEFTKFEQIKIIYEYADTSSIHYLLNKYTCMQIKNKYENSPVIETLIESYKLDDFSKDLLEKTSGKAILVKKNIETYLRLK